MKYHVNNAGDLVQCDARIRACPYSHYSTVEEYEDDCRAGRKVFDDRRIGSRSKAERILGSISDVVKEISPKNLELLKNAYSSHKTSVGELELTAEIMCFVKPPANIELSLDEKTSLKKIREQLLDYFCETGSEEIYYEVAMNPLRKKALLESLKKYIEQEKVSGRELQTEEKSFWKNILLPSFEREFSNGSALNYRETLFLSNCFKILHKASYEEDFNELDFFTIKESDELNSRGFQDKVSSMREELCPESLCRSYVPKETPWENLLRK